jgi:hypothetical protein
MTWFSCRPQKFKFAASLFLSFLPHSEFRCLEREHASFLSNMKLLAFQSFLNLQGCDGGVCCHPGLGFYWSMYGLFHWNAKTHAFQEALAPSMSLCITSFNTTYICSPHAAFKLAGEREPVSLSLSLSCSPWNFSTCLHIATIRKSETRNKRAHPFLQFRSFRLWTSLACIWQLQSLARSPQEQKLLRTS